MTTEAITDLAAARFGRIRAILAQRQSVRVEELCREFGVSAATIRRDLTELDRRGYIQKVHGGAISIEQRLDEPIFEDKAALATAEKNAIAQAALAFIQPKDCIYLDGGSTVLTLAHRLKDMKDLTVVSNSLQVAQALAHAGPRLILIGGEFRRLSQTFVGALTRHLIDELHVDKAFMGTIGFSLEHGLTTTDHDEAFTKLAVMHRAQHVVLLMDSSKVGKTSFAQSGGIGDVDVVVTDGKLDAKVEAGLKRRAVKLVKA